MARNKQTKITAVPADHEKPERTGAAARRDAAPPPDSVALFGGSFNPPHTAHVLVAAWALSLGEVGEIWAFPTGGHPFGKELAPFDDRMEMCRRAFAPFGGRVRVLDIEREPRVHYSIETVERLMREHPDRRWRWLMGTDTLAEASRWRRYDELMRLAPPLAVPRAGCGAPEQAANAIEVGAAEKDNAAACKEFAAAQFALPNVSSTLVRRLLAARDWNALEGLVPKPVLVYAREKRLYDSD